MYDAQGGPLDTLDETALLRLVGEAWYEQFKPDHEHGYYLETSVDIGRREFEALLPMLRPGLAEANADECVCVVARIIRTCSTWRMPAAIITKLALRKGLGKTQQIHGIAAAKTSELHDQTQRARL